MNETHFDAVIVGSGFGGSVMAYRLTEAGLRVCLLERGKAYPPNSFPRAPHRMRKNFWDPSEGLHGMFNVWSFDGLGAVVCSGLSGGSLIYANVLIRSDLWIYLPKFTKTEHRRNQRASVPDRSSSAPHLPLAAPLPRVAVKGSTPTKA